MYTIKENLYNEQEIKKSKFITYIYKVNNIEQINNYLKEIKEKYNDATHICYAYNLENTSKYNDDKEPSKTAGFPILNILKKKNIVFVLVVVIRYFGGIKLGIGNLTRAYTSSVTSVLTDNNIIPLTKGYNINIYFDYEKQNQIDYILENIKIITKDFSNIIKYNLNTDEKTLNKLSNLDIKIEIIKNTYL